MIMSDEGDAIPDDLDEDRTDARVTAGRAFASLIPMVGGVIGEVLTRIIPNQRSERLVRYVRELNRRLDSVEDDVGELLHDPESIDLIEEGGFQAARATTDERIDRIATLVANGLTDREADMIRRKRLARLLGRIDDDELVLLEAYGQSYGVSVVRTFGTTGGVK